VVALCTVYVSLLSYALHRLCIMLALHLIAMAHVQRTQADCGTWFGN
jgi:hypothetical protein